MDIMHVDDGAALAHGNDDDDYDDVYEELISLLSSASRDDVRKSAASAVLLALSSRDTSTTIAARRLTGLNVVSHLCKLSSVASQDGAGSNDALRALLLLCTHEEVGDQCLFDFIRTDAEGEDEEGEEGDEDFATNDNNEEDEEKTSTSVGAEKNGNCGLIRMGGRGVARMLEIALSSPPPSPPPPSLLLANTTTTTTSASWMEWNERVNYACALLANATRTERGAVEFIGLASTTTNTRDSSNNDDDDDDDDVKPQATLLLARFTNPIFVNINSKEYKKAVRVWKGKNGGMMSDNHDNDNDEEDGGGDSSSSSSSRRRRIQLLSNEDDPTIDSDYDDYSSDDDSDDGPSSLPKTSAATTTTTSSSSSNTITDVDCYDPYQHVAAVIMNIAQLERGRNFLIKLIHLSSSKAVESMTRLPGEGTVGKATTSTSHLQSLLSQLTTSPNPIRRQGIAGMIKNCCFSSDSIWWLLHVVHIDKTLLLPLSGPEELSIDEKVGLDPDYWLLGPKKVREADALVRLYIVEALLLLLASGRQARDTLRARRTYVIIKLADMVEEDETVSDRLLECVQYLRRDEHGSEEGSSDKLAYEGYAQKMLEANNIKNSNDNNEGLRDQDSGVIDYDNID